MKKRILSLLLTLVMVISLIPTTAWAGEHDNQVQVIVENTTLTTEAGAPWTGELLNTWVTLTDASTMMTCVAGALEANSIPQVGADGGYISSINDLTAGTGGTYAGWMATLNDWFTNEGLANFTVENGKLAAGDVIRVMYTVTGGSDLGVDWSSTDTTLKSLSFSAGTLSPDFNKDILAYTLTVPSGTESVTVNATAANKMNQVYLSVGETPYRRTAAIPVTNGTILTVKCGDGEGAHTYTVTVTAGTSGSGTDTPPTPPAPAAETLSSLTLYTSQSGTGTHALTPAFNPDVREYSISVADNVSTANVFAVATPTTTGSKVKVSWTNLDTGDLATQEMSAARTKLTNCTKKGATGNTVTLTVGEGASAGTYTVTVKRSPTLKALSITDVPLKETFKATTTNYNAETTAESVTFSATGSYDGYTVTYNGSTPNTVALAVGKNTVTVKVTNPDGGLSKDYTVEITRKVQTGVTFNVPVGASLVVYDASGRVIAPTSGTTYPLLVDDKYTYTVTKAGFKSFKGTYTPTGAESESVNVTLETAGAAGSHATVDAAWKNFRNSDVNMGITNAKTPIADAVLKWNKTLGTGWSNAPSVQIIVDNSLIVMMTGSPTLYKLDLNSGEILKQATMADKASSGYTPPTYTNGLILCPLGNGTVQAFDATTLESVWIYHDPLKGQAQSPITCSGGYAYTGFWNAETKNANYVCLSLTDEDSTKTNEAKYATWSKTVPGGFYWAGSVAVGDFLIFGSDDGASGTTGTSYLYALNKTTGKEISKLALTGLGDQRSSIAYDSATGRVYFTTKGGYLCSAKVDAATGALSELKSNKFSKQSTSTPIVYNGYVYVCGGGGVVEGSGGTGNFFIYNANDLSFVKAVAMQAYPQCSPLLSTAYESDGYLYFYCTYNGNPGGISLIKVKTSDQTATLTELFTPGEGMQNFCICSVICGTDGTLYYKNDSGNVFAVSDNATIAAAVTAKINAIGTVTLNSEAAINAARSAYNALTAAQKALVTNYNTLTAAEATLANLKEEAADKAAADAVKDKINAIGTVTLGSESKINAARSAYNALTPAQKALVSSDTLATLTTAEAKLTELKEQKAAADRAAADAVIAKINAVTSAIEGGDKDAIKSAINDAMAAYNALTAAQKALVTNYNVLAEADRTYNTSDGKNDPIRRQPSATGSGSGTTGGSTANTKDDVKSPTTGDSSHMLLWLSGTLLSAAAIAVLTMKKKRSAR